MSNQLDEVRAAIGDYYHALDTRQHGGVAAGQALDKIQMALGMNWVQGASLKDTPAPEPASTPKRTIAMSVGEWAGFDISLEQRGVDNFTVRYGKQTDAGLTYADAAAKIGQAFMHALACEGRIDNRTKAEAGRGRISGVLNSDVGRHIRRVRRVQD